MASASGAPEPGCQAAGCRDAAGKRRSRRLGSSLEFADYRVYAPGDDVRRFDWGVYSRTGKAFVRQFMDEQELTVSLFVDCSASMGAVMSSSSELSAADPAGTKESPKWLLARQLAASIGYMALSSYDRLQIACYSRSINARLPIMRGGLGPSPVFVPARGRNGRRGQFGRSACGSWRTPRQPGMTWVFSDFGSRAARRSCSGRFPFIRHRAGSGAGACVVKGRTGT